MHEGEMPAIAGGMERGGRLRQVLAHDAGVANLFVTEGQLVVGQTDGARVMRELGVFQRALMQGDRARLLTACERETSLETPEGREFRVGYRFPERIWRASDRGRRLREVILQEPRLGQRRSYGDLVVAGQRAGSKERSKERRGLVTAASF